jgi:peptidoglycan/LPS O-acetylase OafA/YrhL
MTTPSPEGETTPAIEAAPWGARYGMVDAWRALASLGVVFAHLGLSPGFDLGHTCVLIFFVVSGYCIAASTDSCRRNNVPATGYMYRRLRRIYPPYFFALLLFVATRLVKIHAGGADQLPDTVAPWIQNFTLTQWLTLLTHPTSHAFANPTLFVAGFWSLNYEEQFYIVMGLLMYGATWLKRHMLLGVAGLMALGLVWNVVFPSTTFGIFLEYWVCFAVGVLVFARLCLGLPSRIDRLIDLGLWLLFALAVAANLFLRFEGRSAYYEWMITSGFALLLIHARRFDAPYRRSVFGIVLSAASLASYSLYLTHQMNITSSQMFANVLIRLGLPHGSEFVSRTLFMCAFAAVFWFFCERPFVNKPLKGQTRPIAPSDALEASA